MCGIVCAFNINGDIEPIRSNVLKMSQKVRHRGPDWSGIYSSKNAILAHERLAIVDPTSGKQPILSEDGLKVIAVNGEIYNHKKLKKTFIRCRVVLIRLFSTSFWYFESSNLLFRFG